MLTIFLCIFKSQDVVNLHYDYSGAIAKSDRIFLQKIAKETFNSFAIVSTEIGKFSKLLFLVITILVHYRFMIVSDLGHITAQ
ncbi:MAG: hypothetical protein CMK36_03490 [Porticoccaceae bacterium]|nr:hypothetical protein [Porticoccaceae bacterium]